MIIINESQIVIDFKEYSSLKAELKEEIERNLNTKLFMINFTNDLKYNIKVLKRLKKRNDRIKYCGIEYNEYKLIGIVSNENEEIISCIKATFIENRDDRYAYIYDTLCKQLDQLWNNENPCKFENNICIAERLIMKNPRENGCCYAFWYNNIGSKVVGVHQCEHLHPIRHCQNPNLTCKLYVCPYLKKHSKFKIELNKLILVKVFFNRYQKIVLKNNFFIEKNRFLEKLKKDEYRIKPLILYYVDRDFLVYKHVPKDKKEIAKKYEEEYKRTKGLRQK